MIQLQTTEEIKKILKSQDEILGNLIDYYGDIIQPLNIKYYESLVASIIGQQLSNKVADIIRARFVKLVQNEISPERILLTADSDIRGIGVSFSKINYIKNLSAAVTEGKINFEKLLLKDDEEVIKILTSVKGIGRWTAEMFLIFSLGRENIFSEGDGGLCNAIKKLYNIESKISKNILNVITEKWSPYKSFAGLYLWKSIDSAVL